MRGFEYNKQRATVGNSDIFILWFGRLPGRFSYEKSSRRLGGYYVWERKHQTRSHGKSLKAACVQGLLKKPRVLPAEMQILKTILHRILGATVQPDEETVSLRFSLNNHTPWEKMSNRYVVF